MKTHKDELATAFAQADRRWLTGGTAQSGNDQAGNVAAHWAARYKWSMGSIGLLQQAAILPKPARCKS